MTALSQDPERLYETLMDTHTDDPATNALILSAANYVKRSLDPIVIPCPEAEPVSTLEDPLNGPRMLALAFLFPVFWIVVAAVLIALL